MNQTMDSLTDLRDRLESARLQLQQLQRTAIDERTKIRLTGKVEGVSLSLSYLEELMR